MALVNQFESAKDIINQNTDLMQPIKTNVVPNLTKLHNIKAILFDIMVLFLFQVREMWVQS